MNFPLALAFAVVLYVVGAMLLLSTGYRINTEPSLFSYSVLWVLMIPAIFVFAKWYFHPVSPTAKAGFLLGLTTLVVGFLLDTCVVLLLGSDMTLTSFYTIIYADWKFILFAVEILLLTTYAGYEFDSTYTAVQ